MSAKKVPGGGSPIAKRYAFVGHLRNAENTAAVIELLASIVVDYAGFRRSAITLGHIWCSHGFDARADGRATCWVRIERQAMTGRRQKAEMNAVSRQKKAGGSMRMR
jgi:hypothetical protein